MILVLVTAASVATAIWALHNRVASPPPEGQGQEQQTEPVKKLADSIDIPGFGDLYFRSGSTEQNMTVPNPPQNFCWFKVSLVLEDGTVLWTSDLIAPGEESGQVVLNQLLEKGEYKNAMLKYECFADEAGQSALNGAETKLTIIVK